MPKGATMREEMITHPLITQYSEMVERERAFVLEQIQRYKPKKIVEIGIAAGANSVLILDFLFSNNFLDSTSLYALDYNTTYYRDLYGGGEHNRKSGFLVQEIIPHLSSYYHLYTGRFCANHLDKIGSEIDFCIIDTVHSAPGEAFDFLMVLPYLAPNAVIILHDIAYHCLAPNKYSHICALLFLSLVGKKEIPSQYTPYENIFQNIGSCVLAPQQNNYFDLYFRILHMPWEYMPSAEDLSVIKNHILKHYGESFVTAFEHIVALQNKWWLQEPKLPFLKKLRRKIKSKIKHLLMP